jgi:hypothetical protein
MAQRLGPDCLPEQIDRDKMIARLIQENEHIQTRWLPVPPK